MYVAHYADDTVLRVDPTTQRGHRSDGGLRRPAGDGGARRTGLGHLHAVGRARRARRHHARARRDGRRPGLPDSVAVTADGRLAVVAEEGPTLVTVDPATATVIDQTVLGEEPALDDRANLDLALAGGEAWVSSFNADRVYHVPLPAGHAAASHHPVGVARTRAACPRATSSSRWALVSIAAMPAAEDVELVVRRLVPGPAEVAGHLGRVQRPGGERGQRTGRAAARGRPAARRRGRATTARPDRAPAGPAGRAARAPWSARP